jgi:osmoprotectant transport system substrate-binding protein/osmoprotectant transport system permease protein
MKARFTIVFFLLLVTAWAPGASSAADGTPEELIKVGSKKFTESVILGEMAADLARNAGRQAIHRKELGGTRILWSALLKGDIDIYPEYTGTLGEEILAGRDVHGYAAIKKALAKQGIGMTRPLGFNNTYAIGMREERAGRLRIETISDLRDHPDLRFGFGNEFMDRSDGWPGLRGRYRLPQKGVRGMDHDLCYRGLMAGSLDAMDLYATDAEISYYHLRVLRDDRGYFPVYNAVFLYREDLEQRAPGVIAALHLLEGKITAAEMSAMNRRAKIDKVPARRVAADFLAQKLSLRVETRHESALDLFIRNTKDHLALVGISLSAAILFSIPLGIAAAKLPRLGQVILGIVGIIQTIPSLALLVFMIPLLGIGGPPAIMALFLYSLLPIVRNTFAGLHDVPPALRESGEALGLPAGARLRLIDLPMASRTILAGIKTSAVINVGTATLGALIGAGGYGQPILTGIRLDDIGLILQGAVPAAVLALLMQGGFELAERLLVPKGLRIKPLS